MGCSVRNTLYYFQHPNLSCWKYSLNLAGVAPKELRSLVASTSIIDMSVAFCPVALKIVEESLGQGWTIYYYRTI